jgi:hypothetical protein
MDHYEKYLCAVIRKPQEGKTFICLENIQSSPDCYHLIITMNTIKSNLQFFERAKARFGNKICVFNSLGTKKGQTSDFLHAKDVIGVKKHLQGGADIVIMCAHPKRFDESIIDLLGEIEDSRKISREVVIHIDEAHAYVPAWRDEVIVMNSSNVTRRIYMYSATPFSIWTNERSVFAEEQLFKNIYIVDNERQFNVMKSEKYFGVKDCIFTPMTSQLERYQMIDPIIPREFIERWGNDRQRSNVVSGKDESWWQRGAPFDIGDELKMLSYTHHMLHALDGNGIVNDAFSYNFIPGYCRKLTHYALMEMILKIYPSALVIIINGDGTKLFRNEEVNTSSLIGEAVPNHNEPSSQIEGCVRRFPDRPTFITGFHCVGMSVTFINPTLGNFDNVIYSHEHYMDRPDIQYQLCRFLFNYANWDDESCDRIKKTKLFVSTNDLIQNCLDYEKQVDRIDTEMSGSLRNRSEIVGDMKIKEKSVPKERRYDYLEPFTKIIAVQRISVDEGCDDAKLAEVKQIYKDFMGKELKGKAMPKKDEDGFYSCSTTAKATKHTDPSKMKKTIKSWKNTSNFALNRNTTNFARVYVAYDDEDDPSEYTWFIRMMEIKKCPEVDQFWDSIKDA